jgi:hypothetical protein
MQEIEVSDIPGQNCVPEFPACCENQSIIQNTAPIILPNSLQPGERTGQDASIAPYFSIRRKGPMGRYPINNRGNFANHPPSIWVFRVQQRARTRQLGLRNC